MSGFSVHVRRGGITGGTCGIRRMNALATPVWAAGGTLVKCEADNLVAVLPDTCARRSRRRSGSTTPSPPTRAAPALTTCSRPAPASISAKPHSRQGRLRGIRSTWHTSWARTSRAPARRSSPTGRAAAWAKPRISSPSPSCFRSRGLEPPGAPHRAPAGQLRGNSLPTTARGSGWLLPARARPSVLLHGWTVSHAEWSPLMHELAPRFTTYRAGMRAPTVALCPGPPRCPRSSAWRSTCEISWRPSDLEGATIVGHSMGVLTIWEYIRQFGTRGLGRLVLVDQSPETQMDATSWRHGIYGDFCMRPARPPSPPT